MYIQLDASRWCSRLLKYIVKRDMYTHHTHKNYSALYAHSPSQAESQIDELFPMLTYLAGGEDVLSNMGALGLTYSLKHSRNSVDM